jgi:hypothetical protein
MKVPGPDKTQWMRASMYMVIRILIVLALLLPQAVYAACERYVSTDGSGIDCTVGDPCNIQIGIESASSGEEVCLNDGTYAITDQLAVPTGVSVTSTNADKSLVTIEAGASFAIGTPMFLYSSGSAGTNGNQTLSYITLDGRPGGYTAYQGVKILNRDNVTIDNCTIENFYGVGSSTYANGSYGVYVSSGDFPITSNWSAYIGTDFAKENWPSGEAIDGFTFTNNLVDDCGWDAGTDRAQTPSLPLYHLKDSTIHDNQIYGDHSAIKPLSMTAGFWDTVTFYNNYILCHSDGILYNNYSMWGLEVWVNFDCSFYNNKLVNAGFSTTYGAGNKWYHNYVDKSGTSSGQSYCIEATGNADAKIYHNLLVGNPDSGTAWGINVGAPQNHGETSTLYAYVWGNVIVDMRRTALFLDMTDTTDTTNAYFYAHNNTFYNNDNHSSAEAIRFRQDNSGVTGHVYFSNNIFYSNNLGYYTKSSAGTLNLTHDYNMWYDNDSNSNPSSVYTGETNKVTTEPTFTDNYAAASGSSNQVDAGTAITTVNGVDMSYRLHSSTVWGTGSTLPSVVTVQASGSDDIGAYEYATLADTSPPTISSPDPYNGEILDAGTTSYNFTVSVSDATAVSGCRMSDDDESYADMSDDDTMADNGDGTWDNNLTGLTNDTSYTKYIACTDGTNAHTASNNFTSSFSVQSASGGTLLVDNSDAEYAETGSNWSSSTAVAGYYGDNYRTSAKSNETAVWTFTVPLEGIYRVDAQWTEAGNRPVNVDYAIVHSGGTAHIEIDQTQNGGSFQELGTWTFGTGETTVTLTVPLTGYACADAVRMVAVDTGEGETNPAGSGSVTINPAATGSVTFAP